MKYGQLPVNLGQIDIRVAEMFFYQYLPIKFPGMEKPIYEKRLSILDKLIGRICCDYIGWCNLDRYFNSFIYLTAKNLYQKDNCGFNREGWHSDGFLAEPEEINYIWSNNQPTIFANQEFNLSKNDQKSLDEMESQYIMGNSVTYPDNSLLRLNQYVIHKVGDIKEGMRAFVKVSFSNDKYDLLGNSHNHELSYSWKMRTRQNYRNIPQEITK